MRPDWGILVCSPRKNGNSESIAEVIACFLQHRVSVFHLSDYSITPCNSCGYCENYPGKCILESSSDQADFLFSTLFSFKTISIISPIYFYHLPAQLKAWIDRSQKWWKISRKPAEGIRLFPVLLAARNQGENLFSGSLLTLKYFAENLGMIFSKACCLYGLETSTDFKNNTGARNKILEYMQVIGEQSAYLE